MALILVSNFLVSDDIIFTIKLAGVLNSIDTLIRQTVIKLTHRRSRGDVIDKDCISISKLVGKKTHATLKVNVEKIKYIIHYALYLAHYDA